MFVGSPSLSPIVDNTRAVAPEEGLESSFQNRNRNVLRVPGNEVVLQHKKKSAAIALNDLLPETIQTILLNLDLKSISACRLLSKNLNVIITRDNFWISLRARDFPFYPSIKNFSLSPYDIYKSDFTCRSNLKRGRYTSTFLSSQISGACITSRTVANGEIFLGSSLGKIEIINLNTNESLGVLSKEGSCVTFLAVSDKILFSGNLDGTIDVWNLDKRICTNTLKGHSEIITSLVVWKGESKTSIVRLISGSADRTIKIWDPMGEECLSTLEGHTGMINALSIYEEQLFSCHSIDRPTIKIWNLRDLVPQCLHTLPGYKIDIFNGELFTYSEKSIYIWNPKTGEELAPLQVSNHLPYTQLFILDGMLFSSNNEKTEIWDLKTRNCLGNFSRFWFQFSSIERNFDDGKFFLHLQEKGVHFFDFKVDLDEIFADIAATYSKITESGNIDLDSRFERMPDREKEEVYKEVGGRDNFHSRTLGNLKRAQAIESYLRKKNGN